MHSPPAAALAAALLMAGCLGGSDEPGPRPRDELEGYRVGVVFFEADFQATAVTPAAFAVDVEPGARNLVLEIRQESGVLPNLHVDLTGCGGVDPPASASWQAYPLCGEPQAGTQTLTVSYDAGAPAPAVGQLLLRADLPH